MMGISADEFTLNYVTVDQIIRSVSRLGSEALMAKFDVESAYHNVPVHPSYRYLLGMKWYNLYYVDLALPFGLRSAPFIFNVIADLVEWILVHSYQIPDLPHYLDDIVGSFVCSSLTRLSSCSFLLSFLPLCNSTILSGPTRMHDKVDGRLSFSLASFEASSVCSPAGILSPESIPPTIDTREGFSLPSISVMSSIAALPVFFRLAYLTLVAGDSPPISF